MAGAGKKALFGCMGCGGLIFLLAVIGAITGQQATTTGGGGSSGASSGTATSPPPKPTSRKANLKEPFKLGDFSYTVNSVSSRRSIGSGYTKESASEGATFLIVDFTIENLSNETKTVMTDDLKVVDAQSREFRPSSNANTALLMAGKSKDFLVSEVQPGLKRKMQTGFEVPASILDAPWTLVVPEKGFLGTGKVELDFAPSAK